MQPRLVGRWKFDDGDAFTDSVADDVPGAPAHDGTGSVDGFVEGIDEGEAAYFTGTGVVTISDSGEYYNFYPEGLTVTAWVKCELDRTWDGIVGKQSNEAGDWWVVGWSLGVNDSGISSANFSVRNPWTDVFGNPDIGEINDGEWHLVAGSFVPDYSERTCQMRVYVDGSLKDISEALDMSSVLTTSTHDVLIGKITQDYISDGDFHGAIDDVQIYNYALGEMDIAMMYLEQNEGMTVCVDQIEPWKAFDVAGEPGEPSFCKVDIEDFAEFASAWMNCNLLKDCLQVD